MSELIHSDMNSEMNKFFNKLGSSAGVNSADVYNGQKAGYLTGGSISIRNESMNTKLAQIELPRFDSGCGGIDMFAGGFSFINKDQLINNLKSIGSSSIGYAFMLGLETVSPQVANVMKQLQSWSNTINGININSCETATLINGAIWPQTQAASQQICKNLGGKGGFFSDYVSARHKCSNPDDYDRQMKEVEKNSEYKDILTDEYNISWEAIKKQKLLAEDKELSEMFMTLMGTLIKRKKSSTVYEKYPSQVQKESFLASLINGGEINIYTCEKGDKKCLNIKETRKVIPSHESWSGKIYQLMTGIQDKIFKDEELDESQKNILSKSKLPLYKVVNVLSAYKKGACPIDILQLSEIVATDLLLQYLRECIFVVREGSEQLRRPQMFVQELDEYIKDLDRTEKTLRFYESKTSRQFEQEFLLIQKVQMLEEQISSELRI
jgi:conjugative transfer pilus assembly protein TraH